MNLDRITLRLQPGLKRAAEKQAAEENTTLQALFNEALEQYLSKKAHAKAKRIVFHAHDLGESLDSLRRSDYYLQP